MGQVWTDQPTYFVAEIMFTILLFACALHAMNNGRKHFFLWLACLFGGGAIELFTILEKKNIGNFYHSQAMVMLFGKREPFYMLFGVYIWFQYVAVAIPWKCRFLSPLQSAAATGLLMSFLWPILDLVGLKHLWWTWHTHEPLYADRVWGVPVASTFWIIASTASLAFVVRVAEAKVYLEKIPLFWLFLLSLVSGPFASLVLMNAPFILLYHPFVFGLGVHASWPLFALRGLCAVIAVPPLWPALTFSSTRLPGNFSLSRQIMGVFTPGMLIVLSWGSGSGSWKLTDLRRESFGQPLAPHAQACNEVQPSFWGGFKRGAYVCPQSILASRDHFDFHCVDDDSVWAKAPEMADW